MRYLFGQELIRYMKENKKIILLVADIGFGVFNEVKKEFPDRIFNVGIAETAMIGMASGLAMEGYIPICYTITPFLLERPFEAIKINIVNQKQNVKLVSYGDYIDLGPTHVTSDVDKLCECLKLKLYKPQTKEECLESIKKMFDELTPCFMYLQKVK